MESQCLDDFNGANCSKLHPKARVTKTGPTVVHLCLQSTQLQIKREEGLKMSSGEGWRRKDSATKVSPVWETRTRPDAGKMRSGIKVFHDNNSWSSTSIGSLSSIEDEKVSTMRFSHGGNGKRKVWKSEGPDQVSKQCKGPSVSSSDGIRKLPPSQVKKAMTLSSPSSSFRKGFGEGGGRNLVKLRKVKSELCRNLGRPFGALQLVEAETALAREVIDENVSNSDDQEAVVESNLDLGKSPDGIERSGSDKASKELSVCQELAITGSVANVSDPPVKTTFHDEDDNDDGDNDGDSGEEEEEEKKLVLSNERSLSIPPVGKKQYPASAIDTRIYPNQSKTEPEHFHQTTTTQSKLQNLNDLIMWRDASKSALVFGIGAFAAVSSSHTWDFNISFISVLSYLSLVYLAAAFIFRSFIARETIDQTKQQEYSCELVGEEEAIWVMKLVLPYVNECLLNFRALFSGDPITTVKLAVFLFILARYGGSITIWKLAKLGFVGVFTVPKACSIYSTQLTSIGLVWKEKLSDVWKSCSHKKAIGFVVLSVVWNVTSVAARIWTLFVLFVAFKCYQQSFIRGSGEAQEETMSQT